MLFCAVCRKGNLLYYLVRPSSMCIVMQDKRKRKIVSPFLKDNCQCLLWITVFSALKNPQLITLWAAGSAIISAESQCFQKENKMYIKHHATRQHKGCRANLRVPSRRNRRAFKVLCPLLLCCRTKNEVVSIE